LLVGTVGGRRELMRVCGVLRGVSEGFRDFWGIPGSSENSRNLRDSRDFQGFLGNSEFPEEFRGLEDSGEFSPCIL
jgi:hypothetical protein